MVDSVSGKMAPLAGRTGPQSAVGRDQPAGPARLATDRPLTAGNDRPLPAIRAEGPGLVSEGRVAVRRMAAEPPVEGTRVAELRAAIAGGRYPIDPDRIADAMLRSEPGLTRG